MNMLYFQYISTIAEYGSISKAAQKLLLKQQYLSHVVKSVEEEFSIQIFQRHSKGIALTEDGKVLLDYIKQLLTIYDKMHLQYQYPSKQALKNEEINLTIFIPKILFSYNENKAIETYLEAFPYVNINYKESSFSDKELYFQNHLALLLKEDYAISFFATNLSFEDFRATLPAQLDCIFIDYSNLSALASKQTVSKDNIKKYLLKNY